MELDGWEWFGDPQLRKRYNSMDYYHHIRRRPNAGTAFRVLFDKLLTAVPLFSQARLRALEVREHMTAVLSGASESRH